MIYATVHRTVETRDYTKMVEDIATITRSEFEHYRSVVAQVSAARDVFAVWGMTAIMGPIVTGVSVALARYPQDAKSLFYAGASLTTLACYQLVKHNRKYRNLQRELTTLDQ